ncbi:hypothetical protein JCM10213_008861 [Rhodosporidiobolus nylandii]
MSKFVTREIHVPSDSDSSGGEGDDILPWEKKGKATGGASSQHSGRSGGSRGTGSASGGTGGGEGSQPPLPALPDSLMAALAREPPPPPDGTASARQSFSALRPSVAGFSGFGVTGSPSLPNLPPVSPLVPPSLPGSPSPSLGGFSQQPQGQTRSQSSPLGFSTNRTAASPSPSHSPSLGAAPSLSPPTGMSRTTSTSSSTSSSSAFTSPQSNRRSMFKSLAFGRSRSSLPPPPPSSRFPQPRQPSSLGPAPPLSSSLSAAQSPAWSRSASYGSSTAPSSSATPSRAHSTSPVLTRRALSSLTPGPGGGMRDTTFAVEDGSDSEAELENAAAASPRWGEEGARRTVGGGEQYTRDLEREHAPDEEEESASEAGEVEEQTEGDAAGRGEDDVAPTFSRPEKAEVGGLEEDGQYAERPQDGSARRASVASPTTPRARLSRMELRSEDTGTVEGGDEGREAELRRRLQTLGLDGETSSPSPTSPNTLADFVVAVVGPRNVGKSSVIHRGLRKSGAGGQRQEWESRVVSENEVGNRVTTTTTTFSLGPSRRSIEVLEMDMHCLSYTDEGVVWPDGVPQCEGAMLCYDSTSPTSLAQLEILLTAFWTRGHDIPLIVLACKASPDPQAQPNVVDPMDAAELCNRYGAGVVQLDGGLEDPKRKTRECFNWMIRQIMENRGECIIRPASSASAHSPVDSRRGSLRNSVTQQHATHPPISHYASHYATTSRSPVTSVPSSPVTDGSPRPRMARMDSLGLGLSVVQEAPVTTSLGSPFSSPFADGQRAAAQDEQALLDAEADAAFRAALGEAGANGEEGEIGGLGSPASVGGQTFETHITGWTAGASTETRRSSVSVGGIEGEKVALPQGLMERRGSKTSALDLYFRREDMIDKFLFAAVSGNDETFVTLFLITYRRFARPYDVLEKLIEQFEFIASRHKTDPLLSRFGQMKLCGVLSTWIQNYPGDFTAASTFGLLQPFLESLLPRGATWVAHFALELVPLLSPISAMSDPDSSWALPDKPLDPAVFSAGEVPLPPPVPSVAPSAAERQNEYSPRPRPRSVSRAPSLAPSHDSSNSLSLAPSSQPLSKTISQTSAVSATDSVTDASSAPLKTSRSPRPASEAGTLETQDSADALSAPSSSGQGSANLMRSVGAGRNPAMQVLVEVSNAVMELRAEDVATQITRLAWEVFGGISPRDLMRHVLAPRDPTNPRIALRDSESNVMRSIAFVNSLASWTTTMILVQSRVKQRARMLEKMLMVAVALREQENFDSLMGVLAGLNSQPIFRLSETMELVTNKLDGDPHLQPRRPEQPDGDKNRLPKKLRSLNRLMAATKSFAAYRLALANSGTNMIPYLGVHLQDLVTLHEVKSDLRDGRVNWSKLQQMGRSAAIVLDCARVAPQLPVDRAIERCILDAPVLDDDEQYRLSYTHQPRQSGKIGARARLKGMAKATVAFATT